MLYGSLDPDKKRRQLKIMKTKYRNRAGYKNLNLDVESDMSTQKKENAVQISTWVF